MPRISIPGLDDDDSNEEVVILDETSTPNMNGKRMAAGDPAKDNSQPKKMKITNDQMDEDEYLYGDANPIEDASERLTPSPNAPQIPSLERRSLIIMNTEHSSPNQHIPSNINDLEKRHLTSEKLPRTFEEFKHYILMKMSPYLPIEVYREDEANESAVHQAFAYADEIMDKANPLQVASVTSLLLELRRRINVSVGYANPPQFYPYFRRLKGVDTMEVYAFSVLKDCPRDSQFVIGQLVTVSVTYFEQNVEKITYCLGYVIKSSRRPHDPSFMTEIIVMSRPENHGCLVQEVAIVVPLLDVLSKENRMKLHIAPLCPAQDILKEAESIYSILDNPMLYYVKKFGSQEATKSLPTSGILVTSSPVDFTGQQLEAIQTCLDLLLSPVTMGSSVTPTASVSTTAKPSLKVLVLDGSSSSKMTSTLVEVINQFVKNSSTSNLQFVMTSISEQSIESMAKFLKKVLPQPKNIFVESPLHQDDVTLGFAIQYVQKDIHINEGILAERKAKPDAKQSDIDEITQTVNYLSQLMSYMKSPTGSNHPQFIESFDQYMTLAIRYRLKTAKVILGTYQSLTGNVEVYAHLRERKYFTNPLTDPRSSSTNDTSSRGLISSTLIMEGFDLPDSTIMSIVDKFDFSRFIITSKWSKIGQTAGDVRGKRINVKTSFLERLLSRSRSSGRNHPLIVHVGGE